MSNLARFLGAVEAVAEAAVEAATTAEEACSGGCDDAAPGAVCCS